MVNQTIDRKIDRTAGITTTGITRRHLVTLALVAVAGVVVALALGSSTGSGEAAAPVSAETARWEALVAAEYPGATARATAEVDRWTALAAAYESGSILTAGRAAEMARWEALAARDLRAQTTEAARWNGLAAQHVARSHAVQAWADRYQGIADASD